ncbi:MAG: hypothetical protein ACI4M6_03225 [Christensenellaceae bacterium]
MINDLLNYQEIDSKLKAIEDGLKQSEEFRTFYKAHSYLKNAKESVIQLNDKAGALINQLNEKFEAFNNLDEGRKEFEENVIDEADEKQLAFLDKKLQELSKLLNATEQEIARLQQELKNILSQYSETYKTMKAKQAVRDEFKVKYEELAKSKEAEKKNIEKQLSEIEKKIPSQIMAKYKDKRKDGKFPIVIKISDNFCRRCGTELSLSERERLKQNKIIECTTCHNLIYID